MIGIKYGWLVEVGLGLSLPEYLCLHTKGCYTPGSLTLSVWLEILFNFLLL